jgi:galactose mutarotase-like enzyme
MGLWRATLLGDEEIPFGWNSPVRGPVHPSLVPIWDPSGLGWLDGFDELLCRCGLESNGAPDFDEQGRVRYPLHGKIANIPAGRVELTYDATQGEIVLTGVVHETRFHFQNLQLATTLRTKVGEAGWRIQDVVTNRSGRPAGMQLLYHTNFGSPILDAGATLVVPAKTVVPRNARAAEDVARWNHFSAEQPGYAEQVYFMEPLGDPQGNTRAVLKNAHGNQGVSLQFNRRQLPCFTLWKNTVAAADGYVTGLEPGTNFPNPRSFEQENGRVITLKPGESRTFDVQFELLGDAAEVRKAVDAVAALQQGVETRVYNQPQPGWCA